MNRIKDPTLVPNAGVHGVGFVYKDKDTGKVFVHAVPDQVIALAKKHRQVNNYEVPPGFNQTVIDSICENAPAGVCTDDQPPTLAQKISTLTQAVMQAAASGFKTLEPEQVAARQAVCENCQFFSGLRGMFSVSCKRCGCSSLKLHLSTSTCPAGKWEKG